jgi:hypothetical protein
MSTVAVAAMIATRARPRRGRKRTEAITHSSGTDVRQEKLLDVM